MSLNPLLPSKSSIACKPYCSMLCYSASGLGIGSDYWAVWMVQDQQTWAFCARIYKLCRHILHVCNDDYIWIRRALAISCGVWSCPSHAGKSPISLFLLTPFLVSNFHTRLQPFVYVAITDSCLTSCIAISFIFNGLIDLRLISEKKLWISYVCTLLERIGLYVP